MTAARSFHAGSPTYAAEGAWRIRTAVRGLGASYTYAIQGRYHRGAA